jgi:hypothetical protein
MWGKELGAGEKLALKYLGRVVMQKFREEYS